MKVDNALFSGLSIFRETPPSTFLRKYPFDSKGLELIGCLH